MKWDEVIAILAKLATEVEKFEAIWPEVAVTAVLIRLISAFESIAVESPAPEGRRFGKWVLLGLLIGTVLALLWI